MIKQQRKAILLVALACLVVLVRTAQRMAAACAGHECHRRDAISPAGSGYGRSAGYSLRAEREITAFAAPPVLFEGALFAVALLLTLLAAILPRIVRLWPPALFLPGYGAFAIVRLP